MLSYCRHILDYNLIYTFGYRIVTSAPETRVNPSKAQLPKFHSKFEVDLVNFEYAQMTKSPSDITFILTRNQYVEYGIKAIKSRGEFNMRLSNASIESLLSSQYGGVYWNVFGPESLLTEPITFTLLILKVGCEQTRGEDPQ